MIVATFSEKLNYYATLPSMKTCGTELFDCYLIDESAVEITKKLCISERVRTNDFWYKL